MTLSVTVTSLLLEVITLLTGLIIFALLFFIILLPRNITEVCLLFIFL